MMLKLSAFILLLLTSPIFLLLFILIELTSQGPFIFKQTRSGKDKKQFTMYKIRTMYTGAENDQKKFKRQNEADGPVFKIRNDPRYVTFGKWLAHTALDEIPQLINIIKGEMAFVGPRPLPVYEAKKVPKQYNKRFSVLPGMTSLWIVKGAHNNSFKKWMEFDCFYVDNRSVVMDVKILIKTIQILF